MATNDAAGGWASPCTVGWGAQGWRMPSVSIKRGEAGLSPPPAPLLGVGTLGAFLLHPSSDIPTALRSTGRSRSPMPAVPTLLLEPDDLRVGAEAVPRSAVVNGLEISADDVADGQCGDDPLVRADRLHRVAPRGPRFQDVLLPGPSLPSNSGVSPRRALCPPVGLPMAWPNPMAQCTGCYSQCGRAEGCCG